MAHAQHVFLAEFDIDRGAAVRYRYPPHDQKSPSAAFDDRLLAELMLPDGAHMREEDWTIFYLNQTSATDQDAPVISRQRRPKDPSLLTKVLINVEGYRYANRTWSTVSRTHKLVLCLEDSLVSVWDEACSQRILNINDADAEYRQIEPLCVAVFFGGNVFGLRFATAEDEIVLLNHFDDNVKLHRKFSQRLEIPPPPPSGSGAKSLLFVQNLVWMRQVAGARRGTRMLALAVASRHPWIHVVKPLLEIALDSIFQNDRPEVLAALYDTINKLDLSLMPRLTLVEKSILRYTEDRLMFDDKFIRMEELAQYRRQHGQGEGAFSPATMAHGKDRHYFNSTIEFMRNRIAVRIPMAIYPEEIGDFSVIQLITTFSALNAINPPPPGTPQIRWKAGSPYYWHPHLDCGHLTHPIVFLLGALLTQKRVVFLGHQRPAGEVAQYVVAASSMASGGGALLSGFAERCYPYISLSALDAFQATPGLIAGVTNPIVENQHDWWDVLCNINTGRITVSPKLDVGIGVDDRIMGNERERDWMRSGFWDGDNDFVADLVTAIQNNMAELQVRQKLYDYIRRFIDVTATYEIETIGTTGIGFTAMNTGNVEVGVGTFFVDEIAKRKELAMMKNRIEGWRKSKSYLLYQKDFQTTMQRRSMKEVDLQYVVSALKRSTSLDDSTTVRMFLALQDALVRNSETSLTEFLSLLPQSSGGLLPIAAGLCHSRWEVRRAATRLLWRLDWHKVGTRFVMQLNPLLRLTYSRLSRDLLEAAEHEAYLDDPDFIPSVEDVPAISINAAPEVPDIQNDLGRPLGAREKRISQLRQQSARRSLLFDAKNAARIQFNNSLGPPDSQTPTSSPLANSSFLSPESTPAPTPSPAPGRLNSEASLRNQLLDPRGKADKRSKYNSRSYRTSVLVSDDEDDAPSPAPTRAPPRGGLPSAGPSPSMQAGQVRANNQRPVLWGAQEYDPDRDGDDDDGLRSPVAMSRSPPSSSAGGGGGGQGAPRGLPADVLLRKLAEQQAKAEAVKSKLNALEKTDSVRNSVLANVTMEPWSPYDATDHIRMGSREERERAREREAEEARRAQGVGSGLSLRSPPTKGKRPEGGPTAPPRRVVPPPGQEFGQGQG